MLGWLKLQVMVCPFTCMTKAVKGLWLIKSLLRRWILLSGKKLGKGLDALISVESDSLDDEVVSDQFADDNLSVLTSDVIMKAVEDGKKNPRVVVWSPRSSIVLRVLKKSIPEFSISKEASLLLEEAIKRKYPEIWEKVEKYVD